VFISGVEEQILEKEHVTVANKSFVVEAISCY